MRVAVIGSRNLNIDISQYIPAETKEIISGGAKGIDSRAELYASEKKIPIQILRPEYDKYGKSAPLKRNEILVDMSDMIIAVWDGKSRGTKYTIDYARKTEKPIEVHIIH